MHILKTTFVFAVLLMTSGCVEAPVDSFAEVFPDAVFPKPASEDEIPIVNTLEGPVLSELYKPMYEVPIPEIKTYTGTSN